jgi:hypothetical protein
VRLNVFVCDGFVVEVRGVQNRGHGHISGMGDSLCLVGGYVK